MEKRKGFVAKKDKTNRSIIPMDSDEFFQWMIIAAYAEGKQKEWDQLRQSGFKRLYKKFFYDLFRNGIPKYLIKTGKKLYRARQIKKSDQSKLMVDINEVTLAFFKIFLSEEEISSLDVMNNGGGLKFTIEHLFMMKIYNMEGFTDEQKRKVHKLIKENSNCKVYGFSEKDSRVPPKEYRENGRLNSKADEYLYLAFDRDTAIQEKRPFIGQQYSIAEFKTNKNLVMADLRGKEIDLKLSDVSFAFLADKISEPNTDGKDDFYDITQYMTHMLQKLGFDGIVYKSALKKDKDNIVIFNETNVDFISSEIVSIKDVSVDYSRILPFDKRQFSFTNTSKREKNRK
ncbi:MAG: RES family NAD+ phosphorylase [Butyrivibrio sp.]|nr:RES family NAD+ phosphorylase [Butyrivibrio sp.]